MSIGRVRDHTHSKIRSRVIQDDSITRNQSWAAFHTRTRSLVEAWSESSCLLATLAVRLGASDTRCFMMARRGSTILIILEYDIHIPLAACDRTVSAPQLFVVNISWPGLAHSFGITHDLARGKTLPAPRQLGCNKPALVTSAKTPTLSKQVRVSSKVARDSSSGLFLYEKMSRIHILHFKPRRR